MIDFRKEKRISRQTYFYRLLEFLDASLTMCIEEPGLFQMGMEGKTTDTFNLKTYLQERQCQTECSVTYKLWNGLEGLSEG